MKFLVIALLVSFTGTLIAQENQFEDSKSQIQREQDLMNFIKSDKDLYDHYQSGESNLRAANGFGKTSLGFMGGGALLIGLGANAEHFHDGIGLIVTGTLAIMGGAALGTIGIILHTTGKSKIRDVMDYARGEQYQTYGSVLKLGQTNDGLGFTYSF